ncbi:MAG: hypothetical protein ABI895_05485 [Deltaproteobacteria bacterium]
MEQALIEHDQNPAPGDEENIQATVSRAQATGCGPRVLEVAMVGRDQLRTKLESIQQTPPAPPPSDVPERHDAPVLSLSIDGGELAAVLELSAAGAIVCQNLAATLNAAFAGQPRSFVYGCAPENGPEPSSRSVRMIATKGPRSDLVGRSYTRKMCEPLARVLTAAAEDARSGIVFSCEGEDAPHRSTLAR